MGELADARSVGKRRGFLRRSTAAITVDESGDVGRIRVFECEKPGSLSTRLTSEAGRQDHKKQRGVLAPRGVD